MSDAEQISRFCSALLGGPDGLGDDRLNGLRAYLWTIDTDPDRPKKRTRWERADDPHAIASASLELAGRQPGEIAHVYLGTGLLTNRDATIKGEWRRATNDTVSGLFALCVDIDFAGPGHNDSKKVYPPDLAAARTVWEAVPLRPTMVVHTGNGVHVWWCFTEPWIIEPDDDADEVRKDMYDLARDWSATLRYHASRLGTWQIDSTFDLARVMRMPGTLNVKGERVTEPYILECDESIRYEPDEFRDHLADPDVIKTYGGMSPGITVKELPDVDLSQVWARVNSPQYRAAEYTPPWLEMMLELMPGSNLEAVWLGQKTMSGDSSPSGVDAALVRALIQTKHANTERLVEAVMCRRLRTGEKVEKVDPTRRTDYLVTTIAKVQASAEQGMAASLDRMLKQAQAPIEPMRPDPEVPEDADLGDFAVADIAADDPPPAPGPTARTPPPVTDGATARAPQPQPVPVADIPKPPPRTPGPADAAAPTLRPPQRTSGGSMWPARNENAAACMETLSQLLLSERDLKAGVEVYGLEYRDHGESQRGRMILSIPAAYQWEGDPPPTYRPGRPFYCEWYKRDAFDVPKGYRNSLIRDALLRALQVGANRDAWVTMIDLLVPHWQRDSSGSDLIAQMHEWLHAFLVGVAPTTKEEVAVDNRRAYLVDNAGWGTLGTPELLVCQASLLDFVARQPGGIVGRNAKTLLGYLDIDPVRPRMTGSNGKKSRVSGWFRINRDEFDRDEWDDILEVTRDALHEQEQRGLRVVKDRA